MSERLLVCEGACNPGIQELDAAVRKYRSSPMGTVARRHQAPMISDDLYDRLHGLRHTPHKLTALHGATCLSCGTERRYW